MGKRFLSALLLPFISTICLSEPNAEPPKPPQSIPELREQLEKILKDTHTPGLSVAIVRRDGPEWVAGLGKADVAAGRNVTPETLFRIGSTSKAFASLSILKLVREGKISLDDPVHKLVPDVGFDNRWEATDPVRVVNLLEHTTGWDDMHLREYAKEATGMTLHDALDYGRSSRFSRWPPGTRMAYCNTGPTVAAYIVERVTGQRFEDYVEQNFFMPIGMKTATYFKPDAQIATVLYRDDGKTPVPYWNMIYRPAGSINASAQDMASYVQFYLNRGAVNGTQLVPAAEIDSMESPSTTWAAREGLKSGYGLSNYWNFQEGFVFHGHNGGLEGALTEMGYLPDNGVGYFFSTNTGNGDAFGKIGKAIRSYTTLKLQKPPVPAIAPLPPEAAAYTGWYAPNNPRQNFTMFLERLAGLSRVHFADGKLLISNLNETQSFIPVSGKFFRYVGKDGPPEPAASVALLAPNSEGRFIQAGMSTTYKFVPAWLALLEIALVALVLLSMSTVLLYAPFWLIGGFFRQRRRPAERAMRIWPLLAVLSFIAFVATFILGGGDIIHRLGNLTFWSASLCLITLFFAAASLMSAFAAWRIPSDGMRKWVRIYSIAVSAALMIATAYLAYWGIIGIRTWA
jgi:CubicO group peptidase (beta-lactamase class C family)